MESAIPFKGRGNDTMLAHINAREAKLLELFGGSGTINPKTGLLEFWDDGGNDPGGVGGDTGSTGGVGTSDSDSGTVEGIAPEGFSFSVSGVPEDTSVSFGEVGPDKDADTHVANIAELAHPKNTLFENLMDRITTNIEGMIKGFTTSMAGRTAGKALGALAFGINPASLAGLGLGIVGSRAAGYIAENASPPSAETVAGYTSPNATTGAGMEDVSTIDSPGIETAGGTPSATTAIPSRRALIQQTPTYARQRAALTGLPVR